MPRSKCGAINRLPNRSDRDKLWTRARSAANLFCSGVCSIVFRGRSFCSWPVRLMRVLRVLKDGELALTHLFSPSQPIPRTFHHPHLLRNSTTQHRTVPFALFRMASTLPRRPEWTASQVRETFLDYFKKNGHTFGTPNFAPPLLWSFFCPSFC